MPDIALRLVLTMVFNGLSVLAFMWLRRELGTGREHSIELCVALITLDAAIYLGALDLCCMFWWPFMCTIEKSVYSFFGLLTLIAAIFIVNRERHAGVAEMPAGLPWREQLPHFYRQRGRFLAAAATMRFAIILLHAFWVARVPKWT